MDTWFSYCIPAFFLKKKERYVAISEPQQNATAAWDTELVYVTKPRLNTHWNVEDQILTEHKV